MILAIRDGKLYREQHATFEKYCQERWGMSRTYSFRVIEAAKVSNVLPIGNKPANEAQARPLAKLPAPEQPKVWRAATVRPSSTIPTAIINAVRIAAPAAYRTPTHTLTPPEGDRAFTRLKFTGK